MGMRFKKGIIGYFKLGLIFTIFSSIFSSILIAILAPGLLGAGLFGGLPLFFAALLLAGIIMIIASGWFIFWFATKNKFVR